MARIPRRMAGVGAADIPDAAAFDAYVGPARELTVDPARGIARLHDGSTPGGRNLVSGTAAVIGYDNDASGLAAENLQEAVDELAAREALPAGGATGEVLAKASAGDGDAEWVASFSRTAGFLYGLTLSNNVSDANNDINIASGSCRSIENNADIVLASALTKRLDAAWAVGSGNGGLDTGSKANSTGYHVWLIRRPDTGVVDVLFSTSATSPVMPANYTQKRRIGAILTDASGNIRPFLQTGGWFMLKTPIDYTSGDLSGDTAMLKTLPVPLGIKLLVKLFLVIGATGGTSSAYGGYTCVSDPDLGAPGALNYAARYSPPGVLAGAQEDVWTSASGQVYMRSTIAQPTATQTRIQGWYDVRDTSV